MRLPPSLLSNPQTLLLPFSSGGAIIRGIRGNSITPRARFLSRGPSLSLQSRNHLGCTGSPAGTKNSIILSTRKNKLFTAASTSKHCSRLFTASPLDSASNMATATRIKLSTTDSGVFSVGVRADSAQAASEVLQEDMEKHHIFFNAMHFHSEYRFFFCI